jgi:hypothetical protein
MAVISHKYKFIYALAPRTASTATADHLIKKLAAEWIPNDNLLDEGEKIKVDKKHCTFSELIEYNILQKHIIKKYLTFVTVRNPFESLYSAWYKKKYTYTNLLKDENSFIYKKPDFLRDMLYIKDHSFSDWIIENYEKLAYDSVERHINGTYLNYSNRVLRFEYLNEDFKTMIQDYNLPYPGEIPIINKTEGKPSNYREFYTAEARDIIEKTYSLDLEKFSYIF